MRGDKSFAYDLIVRYGPVSSRVALLLRSAEGKPPSTRFVFETLHLRLWRAQGLEGDVVAGDARSVRGARLLLMCSQPGNFCVGGTGVRGDLVRKRDAALPGWSRVG